MHRNTLLFVSFLAVIAALLVGFNVGRSLSPSQGTPTPTPQRSPTPTVTDMSASTCGVSFAYPDSLTAMESTGSGMILASTTAPETSIVIVCQAEIPRVALTPDKIETVTIMSATGSASVSAKLYHDTSAKDGAPMDKLIFTHPKTGLDVFIAGFGPAFTRLVTSLRLIP